jgi:hypothetical protein
MTAGNTLLSVWGPGTEENAEKAAVAKALSSFKGPAIRYAEDYCHLAVGVLPFAKSWTSQQC